MALPFMQDLINSNPYQKNNKWSHVAGIVRIHFPLNFSVTRFMFEKIPTEHNVAWTEVDLFSLSYGIFWQSALLECFSYFWAIIKIKLISGIQRRKLIFREIQINVCERMGYTKRLKKIQKEKELICVMHNILALHQKYL